MSEPSQGSQGPFADVLPPSPERREGRHPVLLGIVVGAVGLFAILALVGYLTERTTSEVPFEEDFSSTEPGFPLDSDEHVDLSIANGQYHILMKDAASPQLARHVFDHTYDGLRFESTVMVPDPSDTGYSVGCWSGDHAYLLVIIGGHEAGLVETVSESTGERHPLTDRIDTNGIHPAGEPNRLRIDCIGGGTQPTIVSGWINGEAVASVTIPEGWDSFDAVGFFLASERDGTEFVVDDVIAVAERPAPGRSPVPAIAN